MEPSSTTLLLGSLAVTYLIHSTILIGGVWALLKLLKPKPAQLRENLLRVALLGSVVTVTLQLFVPLPFWGTEWSLYHHRESTRAALRESVTTGIRITAGDPLPYQPSSEAPAPTSPAPSSTTKSSPAPVPEPAADSKDASPTATPPSNWAPWEMIAWLWIAGCAVGLLRLLVQFWRLSRLRSQSTLAPNSAQPAIERLAKEMGYGRSVTCRLSRLVSTPIAFGFRRQWIVFPTDLYHRLPAEQIDAVLAHELAHLIRRDSWWNLLAQTICLLFFFQPLHFWVRRQLRQEAEFLADQHAARVLPDSSALAACLVSFGEWFLKKPASVSPLASGMAAYRSLLAKRIETLVNANHTQPNRWVARVCATLTALALGTIIFGAPRVLAETNANQNNEKDNDMKFKTTTSLIAASVGLAATNPTLEAADEGPISIKKLDAGNKSNYAIRIGEKPFTTLLSGRRNGEIPPRPVLYPIYGPDGTKMTRDFPFSKDTKGEAHDHPHHQSLWYGHGNVNGVNFWHLGKGKGTIRQTGRAVEGNTIWMSHNWNDPDGKRVCSDLRTMRFSTLPDGSRMIEFSIKIMTSGSDVTFGDTKEGTMAIRSNPNLRIDKGAQAINSAGDRGKSIWGKAAKWVNYQNDDSGFAIFDHPTNPRHPTTWHARDYGLVAANPFGASHFSGAKPDTGNFVIKKDDQANFHYAFVFHRGKKDKEGIEKIYADWSKKKKELEAEAKND